MSNIRDLISALGVELSEESNAAHDLWTWLPSYKATQRNHGDYASNHTPTVKDVLIEAVMYIASLKHPGRASADERDWFERCACGGDHDEDSGQGQGKEQ